MLHKHTQSNVLRHKTTLFHSINPFSTKTDIMEWFSQKAYAIGLFITKNDCFPQNTTCFYANLYYPTEFAVI